MRIALHWASLACLLLVGCETAVQPSSKGGDGDDQTQVATSATTDDDQKQVEVQVKTWAETSEWVAGQRGKIVILDAWAMW